MRGGPKIQPSYPFRIPSTDKWCPFHIPNSELCIPFNCCRCVVFNVFSTFDWVVCGTQWWNGLSPSKKTKWRTAHPEGIPWPTAPFSGADFCGKGTDHFRSFGIQIWKSIWNDHTIIAWGYRPYVHAEWSCIEKQYSMNLLACAGAAETMTSQWSPREKLQLVLHVKILSLQERNMLFDSRSPLSYK